MSSQPAVYKGFMSRTGSPGLLSASYQLPFLSTLLSSKISICVLSRRPSRLQNAITDTFSVPGGENPSDLCTLILHMCHYQLDLRKQAGGRESSRASCARLKVVYLVARVLCIGNVAVYRPSEVLSDGAQNSSYSSCDQETESVHADVNRAGEAGNTVASRRH